MTRTRWIPAVAAAALLAATLTTPPAVASATVTLTGTVRDGSGHGWPLYSRVSIDGAATATYASPWDGRYRLELMPDTTYTVRVAPEADGYPELTKQVHTGRRGTVLDLDVPVDADRCTAPGYQHTSAGAVASFDTGTTPAGWTVTDDLGNSEVWRFDDLGRRKNLTGGRNGFAIVDSELYGLTERQDTSLVSPVVDLSGVAAPTIGFRTDFNMYETPWPYGVADVDLSLDGGSTWTTAWHRVADLRGPEQVVVPIPQAAGKSQVRARFRYSETEFTAGGWWELDDVYVGDRSCDPVPGGMVAGYTTDHNTTGPLVGAAVTGPGESATVSLATPGDPAVRDGYYSLFVPAAGDVTAARPKYQSLSHRVDVRDGHVLRSDFPLAAGRITTASSVQVDQELGDVTTKTVTLRNTGTATATVNLTERPGHFELLTPRRSAATTPAASGAPLRLIDGVFSPFASGAPKRAAPPQRATPRPAAAKSLAAPTSEQSWTGVADYPEEISDNAVAAHDGRAYSVGGESEDRYGITDAFVYDPSSTSWSGLPDMPHGRQAPTAAFVDGKLVVVGGWGPSDFGFGSEAVPQVDIYDPASNRWTAGADTPHAVAAAGSAVLDGRLYVVGGCHTADDCGTNLAYRYAAESQSWERVADYPEEAAWLSCGAVEGVVYCTGGTRRRDTPGPTISSKATYAYDPGTNSWGKRADLPIDLWASFSTVSDGTLQVSGGVTNGAAKVTNQGFRYDPVADGWTALPNSTYAAYRGGGGCGFYKVGGGTSNDIGIPFVELLPGRSDCGSDRDAGWLSADRTVGITLQPGQQTQVRVRFDASTASQPGTFDAKLLVRGDTPYPAVEINAAMKVDPPDRWGVLTGTVTGASCDGSIEPLPGASVWLDGRLDDFTVPTDEAGTFGRWLDSRNGPATMIVGLDGWIPETRTVRLTAQRTTTENVRLHRSDC